MSTEIPYEYILFGGALFYSPKLFLFGIFIYFSQKCKTLSYVLAVYMNHNYNLHTKGDYIIM